MRKGNNPVLDIGYWGKISLRRDYMEFYVQFFPMKLEGCRIHYSLKEKESNISIPRDNSGECTTVKSTSYEWLKSLSPYGHPSRPHYITNLQSEPFLQGASLHIPKSIQILQLSIKTSWHNQGDRGTTAKGWHYTWELSNVPICSLGPANTCSYENELWVIFRCVCNKER